MNFTQLDMVTLFPPPGTTSGVRVGWVQGDVNGTITINSILTAPSPPTFAATGTAVIVDTNGDQLFLSVAFTGTFVSGAPAPHLRGQCLVATGWPCSRKSRRRAHPRQRGLALGRRSVSLPARQKADRGRADRDRNRNKKESPKGFDRSKLFGERAGRLLKFREAGTGGNSNSGPARDQELSVLVRKNRYA